MCLTWRNRSASWRSCATSCNERKPASGRRASLPWVLLLEFTMLGQPEPRLRDQPIAVSLEDLIPADNFYRHLEAKLDLRFVRDWTQELYAERGRPSIDPVVFFKLQLVMFFEGIRSARQLIATASLNLAHRMRFMKPVPGTRNGSATHRWAPPSPAARCIEGGDPL